MMMIKCFVMPQNFFCRFYYWYAYAGLGFSDLVLQWNNFGVVGKSAEIYKIDNGATLTNYTNVAASVYFVSLVYMQIFGNLLSTRTRHLSIFQHNPIWGKTKNPWVLVAMVISTIFAVVILYIPPLQVLFQISPIPTECWFIPVRISRFANRDFFFLLKLRFFFRFSPTDCDGFCHPDIGWNKKIDL